MPFPVALVKAGKGVGPVAVYGIDMYPTTVLIDPEGKVVGTFGARDAKAAVEKVEKLLGKKK